MKLSGINGDLMWSQQSVAPGAFSGNAIAVQNGFVHIGASGHYFDAAAQAVDYAVLIQKIDSTTGELVWNNPISTFEIMYVKNIAIDTIDGSIIIGGYSSSSKSSSTSDVFLFKLSDTAGLLWGQQSEHYGDLFCDMALDKKNDIIIATVQNSVSSIMKVKNSDGTFPINPAPTTTIEPTVTPTEVPTSSQASLTQ